MARDGDDRGWMSNLPDDLSDERFGITRAKLITFLARKGCPASAVDELADEAIRRWGEGVSEKGKPGDLAFLYAIARNVHREYLRKSKPFVPLDELPPGREPSVDPPEDFDQTLSGLRLRCLRQCLQEMKPRERELILGYYEGSGEEGALKKNRARLAAKLNISPEALTLRAMRLRTKIGPCVKDCLSKN